MGDMATNEISTESTIRGWTDDKLARELEFCCGGRSAPGGLGPQEAEYLALLEAEAARRPIGNVSE
jgi:hypothetical protein